MAQVHRSANTWREGQPGMWRPGPADRWHPTLCDGAAARGSLPTFGIHARTDACTQVGASGRWSDFRPSRHGDGAAHKLAWVVGARQIFRHREMVLGLCRAARVSESDGATAQAVCRPCVSSHTDACSHLGAGGGCDRFCHREIVLGLCRWKRTVGESVGELWRDGAGRLKTLGLLMCM